MTWGDVVVWGSWAVLIIGVGLLVYLCWYLFGGDG